jgi:hypothetical protein
MPKYTVYATVEVTYSAEVVADSPQAIYDMDDDDINYVETDSSSYQISSIHLNGEQVGLELSKSDILMAVAQENNLEVINVPLVDVSESDLSGYPTIPTKE